AYGGNVNSGRGNDKRVIVVLLSRSEFSRGSQNGIGEWPERRACWRDGAKHHTIFRMQSTARKPPQVIIIGAGFGGLEAAKKLACKHVRLTVIDRTNYHLFQPLLYQVATAALSPADIAAPIRGILSKCKNVEVVLAEVESVDVEARKVI